MKNLIYISLFCGILVGAGCKGVKHTGVKQNTASHDNGKHKGWYKNTNNPHNPGNTTAKKSSPGQGNSSKAKGKK